MKNKRILLIGGNFYPELTGIGKYNGEMVDWLAAKGYQCTVITSYPYYPYWQVQKPYLKNWYWFKKEQVNSPSEEALPVEIYRCPQYVPARPSGLKRMMLDFSFSLSVLFVVLKLLSQKKYSHVISVVPSFQLGLLAILYKKIRGAKFLYHIQDLQIDAARDLQILKSPTLLKFLFKIEKYILKHADVVSSISEGMIEKVKDKCDKDVVPFLNWVDTSLFYPMADKETLKAEFGFNKRDKIVLYSGAIGEKQGLECILYAAKELSHLNNVKFVICGSGPYKKNLEMLKENLGLENIVFMPLQPAAKLNHFLNMADVHLVIQKANASDLVMPSKLTTILSTGGVALVTAPEQSSLYKVVAEHNMGFLVEPEDQEALTNTICTAITADNGTIISNARTYAKEHLAIDKILSKYSAHLE